MKDKKSKKAAADKKADKLARKKKHTGCKGEKAPGGCKGCAKAKASLALSHCTCCKKRCPLSKPKCGKGRRLAARPQAAREEGLGIFAIDALQQSDKHLPLCGSWLRGTPVVPLFFPKALVEGIDAFPQRKRHSQAPPAHGKAPLRRSS